MPHYGFVFLGMVSNGGLLLVRVKLLLLTHDILKFFWLCLHVYTFQSHISENQAANHWTVWVSREREQWEWKEGTNFKNIIKKE